MSKKLLLTTALVTMFSANTFAADDNHIVINPGKIESTTNDKGGDIVLWGNEDINNYTVDGTQTLIAKKINLDTRNVITGTNNPTLNITGYLTQDTEGTDISGVDINITETNDISGGLAFNTDLKVGNINFSNGTMISPQLAGEQTLIIADNKTITFGTPTTDYNPNRIWGVDGAAVKFSGGNVILNNGLEAGADLTFDNTKLNLNSSFLDNQKNIIFENGSTLAFNIDEDGKGGKLKGTEITLKDNTTLIANLGSNKTLSDSGYTFVEGTVSGNGKWTSSLYDYKFNDDNNTITSIDAKSSTEIAASTGASASEATVVAAVIANGDSKGANAAFDSVAKSINDGLQSSDANVKAAALKTVEQISSDTTSSAQTSTVTNTAQVFGAVGSRMSGGSASASNLSSGDSALEGGAVWAQVLTNDTKLKGSNGFDSNSDGIAFGAEKQINDEVKAGVGYAYTKTDISTSSRSTDADTNSFMIYGEYKPSNWFVNGIASYSFSSYDESSNTKTASYDIDAIALQAMTGYDMNVSDVNVTPEAGLRYVNVSQDSYTDSLGSKISGDSSDILTAVVGAKANKNFALENGMNLRPEAKFAATYDIFNDDANSVVTLANGSTYTSNSKALDKFGMEFGLGLTADINENVELTLGYEGKFRSDYEDHTGTLNAKYKF